VQVVKINHPDPFNLHIQVVQAKVMEDAGGLSDTMSTLFNDAAKQMKAGDTQHACENWSKIRTESPSHMPTVFNLGVCEETAGHYSEALKQYNEAGELLAKPDTSSGDNKGVTGWLRSATTNAQNMVNRPGDDIAAARARVTKLMAAQGQLTAIEDARKAETERKRQEAAALERQRQEEEARQEREAAAERARQEVKAAAAKRQEQARGAAATQKKLELAAVNKRELVSRFGDTAANAILEGKVVNGMSKDAVVASIGKPQSEIRASATEEMWQYSSQKVIFTNGKVSYVGH
jgi:hypothetical protein